MPFNVRTRKHHLFHSRLLESTHGQAATPAFIINLRCDPPPPNPQLPHAITAEQQALRHQHVAWPYPAQLLNRQRQIAKHHGHRHGKAIGQRRLDCLPLPRLAKRQQAVGRQHQSADTSRWAQHYTEAALECAHLPVGKGPQIAKKRPQLRTHALLKVRPKP